MADRNVQNIQDIKSIADSEIDLQELNKKWWGLYSQIVDRVARKLQCMPGFVFDISIVPFDLKECKTTKNKTLGEFGEFGCETSGGSPFKGGSPEEKLLELQLRAATDELKFTWENICSKHDLGGRELAVLLWMIDYTNRSVDFSEHIHHAYMGRFEYFDSYFRKLSVKASEVAKALSIPPKEAYNTLIALSERGLLFKQDCTLIPDDRKCIFSLVTSIFDELFPEKFDDSNYHSEKCDGGKAYYGMYPSSSCNNPFDGPGILLESNITLDDVVLPESTRDEMLTAMSQVKHGSTIMEEWGLGEVVPYGRGVIILLCGPPGTGKTMSAIALSGELKKPLYHVEYHKLVSKYFGETEKNIHEAFQKAAENDYILLLDEVDSVLTNRTSVGCSGDAAENRDTNVLLRELEGFDGVVILTTNLIDVLDRALSRRLNLTIHFDMPDRIAQRKIWEKHLPRRAPLSSDVDIDTLAEYPLSGGNIKNAVLIGFRIAASRIDSVVQEKVEIHMEDFMKGVEHEQRKAGIMDGGKLHRRADVFIEVA